MYFFRGIKLVFFCGVVTRGIMDDKEFLGARDQVDVDVVKVRGAMAERDVERSDMLGEPVRLFWPVCARDRDGVTAGARAPVEVEFERLVVRCREAKVDPNNDEPDTERLVDATDNRLLGRVRGSSPETTRRELTRGGTFNLPLEGPEEAERCE